MSGRKYIAYTGSGEKVSCPDCGREANEHEQCCGDDTVGTLLKMAELLTKDAEKMTVSIKLTIEGKTREAEQDFSEFPQQIKELELLSEVTGLDLAVVFLRCCSVGIDLYLEELGKENQRLHMLDFNMKRLARLNDR